ncbi:acyl-CoA N-acyltransferase [Hyaloscypha variabilis F]|uniref:Acyl-CoA N-acyltransferase n=1 Tax=Hyaloscypha variabilis (strain UAMH 11265 / GT02V1 / F) TaxID=1149755 RepID=A0A2J6SCC4_HYAVF|nr:acyl-CoA N-acyltransferase [Hyaloscypha variabilis F]
MASESIEVTLSHADTTDLPALAEINRLAYMQETISMIAFKDWPAETNMFNFFQARIKARMETPNTLVFKALTGTGEIAGFVCWTLEPEKVVDEATAKLGMGANGPTGKALLQMQEIFNLEFIMAAAPEMENMGNLVKGQKHYYLSAFVVTPKYQRKGIGSKLLRHCLEIADRDVLPAWLSAFPGSHSLYLRFGFEDVEHQDIDLNKWDHYRFRGFGIYRQYFMARQPKTKTLTT